MTFYDNVRDMLASLHTLGVIYSHSTSISACGVWGVKAGVQVSKNEISHTYTLRLGYSRISILYKKEKKKKKKKNLCILA